MAQNALLFTPQFVKQREYWLKQLYEDSTGISFPHDRPGNPGGEPAKKSKEILLPAGQVARLEDLCSGLDLSIYIVFVTVLEILLYRYTGHPDLIVVSPLRKQAVSRETVNNRVFICTTLNGGMTFKELLLNVRRALLGAYENQDYPIDTLLESLFGISRNEGKNALAQVLCTLDTVHDSRNIEILRAESTFSFYRGKGGIRGEFLYDGHCCSDFLAGRISCHFTNLLTAALGDPGCRVAEFDFLDKAERQRLLWDLNDTGALYPGDKTVQAIFSEQASKTPDAKALLFKDLEITYDRLENWSNRIARYLKERGAGVGKVIALLVDRSPEAVAAMLGILKSASAYLPIDPVYPTERIRFILADSGADILLTDRSWEALPTGSGHAVVFTTLSAAGGVKDAVLPRGSSAGEGPGLPRDSRQDVGTPAYVIYTSGTTGKPKGAVIEHRGLTDYTCWAVASYVRGEAVDFPLYTSLAFDLTVTSIFTPLVCGNAVVVYEGEEKAFLLDWVLADNRVDIVKLTPSHLKLLKEIELPSNSRVRRLIVGGERLDLALAKAVYDHFAGRVEIYNEYGPTETVVGCMIYRYDPGWGDGESVPIGLPAANTGIYLLDKDLNPVPTAGIGEIYISGHGVCRGYLNRPETTAAAFFEDPFRAGGRMYRTGDLARRYEDGNVEFLGRVDEQIKIRGHRIEVVEIETCLKNHDKIKDAVVIVRQEPGQDPFLCAYLQTLPQEPLPAAGDLQKFLLRVLPEYMVPVYYLQIDRIPLTANGKVNAGALPSPQLDRAKEYVAPGGPIQKEVAQIWAQVLGVDEEKIGIHDNFFELGGHSLKATVIVLKIHKALGVRIPLEKIFKYPTVAGISEIVTTAARDDYKAIQAVEKKTYYPLSSAQKRLFSIYLMDCDSIAYNMPFVVPVEPGVTAGKIEHVFQALVARHESLRTSFTIHGDEPVQRVLDRAVFQLEKYKGEENPAGGRAVKAFVRPFDLSLPPLIRAGLVYDAEGRASELMVDMHHIVSDGVSQVLLEDDFNALYEQRPPYPLKLQYKDYAKWQNDPAQIAAVLEQEKYWLAKFSGDLPVLNLPYDFPVTGEVGYEADMVAYRLVAGDTAALFDLGKREHATLFIVVLSLYYILLAKLAGQDDIVVGAAIEGRSHPDLEHIVGMFVNMLALRGRPLGELAYVDFLREVRELVLEAFENQDYPFDDLVSKTVVNRDLSINPIFKVVLNYLTNSDREADPVESDRRAVPLTIKFDLLLTCSESKETLDLRLLYNVRKFKRETAESFMGYFKEIVRFILDDPGVSLDAIVLRHHLTDADSAGFLEDSDFD